MIKRVTHAHLGPIWYLAEPSDVTYSPKPVSWLGLFLPLLQQGSSKDVQILYTAFPYIVS